ncbi:Serologically defined colon cancer antigen 8 like protein [Trachymyrmex septentrionalis]|uniref:Serologically defined colon cancer antigen 8 like protein n=1 Tax=Trachymyrmex septentrionalis TaxID=34720 RepID=A0A151JVJ3_9HYME|nr:PREDICTED: serologically defined colon cancer antigen 8 homolog isoform X2 [Trachymyrmex septentrionalis]KYN37496.1 Serologically defined colon cancer antigen 8 like protein [Trachymyrmex septentrionalis]
MLTTNSPYGCRECHPFVPGSVTSIATNGNPSTTRPKFSPRITTKLKTSPGISSYTDPACVARMKRLKNRKTNASSKLDLSKRKPADYMELAYRDAISKLKYLLAESYAPTGMSAIKQRSVRNIYKSSNPRISESGEDTDDQSMISDNFRRKDLSKNAILNTFPLSKTLQSSKAYSNIALSRADLQSIPPELTSFIERQEDYIEQLERESQYCRDELINLLSKVREVVAENEALHSRNQVALSKCVLQDHKDHCGANHECHKQETSGHVDNTLECKREKSLEGPSIIFESRISELEAQLTQAKLELRKAQEENQANLKRLFESGSSENNAELKAELDKALRAKYEAEIKLEELQKLLSVARDKETEATHRAKRSMDDRHEIEFERNQSEMEIRRLKDELERQHEKLREAAQDANRRITEERQQVERRYNQQIEQLTADIATHWETTNKSQLESEKQRREINELRRELSQKQNAMDNLKKELQNKISTLQSDLNQALSEKDAAEQEVLTGKLAAERNDRQARQEQSRLQAEINSYKQRLERADADLVHCRRENLRLSEQIASLEKEISMSKIVRSEENRSEVTPRLENEKELTSMIMNMETKHAATVAGLEDALSNQAKLVSRLTTECQSLTQRLEANNLKHKEEMADLQSNIENLSSKIQGSLVSHAGEITMETNDGTGAFHYNATMDSLVSPHTNGSGAQAQMMHQGYDTASGQKVVGEESEIYSDAPKRNDQMQGNFASNMETAEMYQQQGNAQNNEEYPVNDSNMETYMMEHDQNQYEYDPSQYPEEQYVNDNQFNMMADQTENNQSST